MPWKGLDHAASAKVMKAALDNGANFWNGVSSISLTIAYPTTWLTHVNQGIHYGTPDNNSLHLLKHFFTTHPSDASRVVLSIKGAYDARTHTPTGSPAALRAAVEGALAVLDGCKTIDIFEMARVDPNVPIEESIEALAELVAEGKIGGVGLSEVGAATIRRAAKITKIAAVEIEMSLFTTDALENGVVEACRERESLSPFHPNPSLFLLNTYEACF